MLIADEAKTYGGQSQNSDNDRLDSDLFNPANSLIVIVPRKSLLWEVSGA